MAAVELKAPSSGSTEALLAADDVSSAIADLAYKTSLASVANVAYPVLQKLSSRKWTLEQVAVRPLKGAMTNRVFECFFDDSAGKKRRVLVRIYGDGVEQLVRREDEIETFERLSAEGQGPRLLARFPEGRVEEWLHAHTLTAQDLRDPLISPKIAAKLRAFHKLEISREGGPLLWHRLRNWLEVAISTVEPAVAAEFKLLKLGQDIDELEMKMRTSSSRVGFCHNDLQYGNIMADDLSGTITLIDYEYSSYNYIAFDIANHFCEWAANYHSNTPHVLDYSKYPSFEERCRFIAAYLGAAESAPVSQEEVKKLAAEAEEFVYLSHLHWGLWGIISAASCTIDFDYLEYARQRFEQYSSSRPFTSSVTISL